MIINHSWLCLQSKDIAKNKSSMERMGRIRGHISLVDDVEIHPELIVDYIQAQ